MATLQKTFVHLDRSAGDILHFQGAAVVGTGSKQEEHLSASSAKQTGSREEAEAPEKLPIKLPIYRMKGEVLGDKMNLAVRLGKQFS